MKLLFLGGADEVGASSTLIEIGGKRILVDCGIRPSPKAHGGLAGDQLPNLEQIAQPDAILVTHAHSDHTGALELVTERFPDIPVYATAPTVTLTRVLHQDARRIMQSRLDEEGELPLFDDVSVQRLMSAFVPVPYRTRLPLGEGLAVTFFPAGHIAGAAMLGLESDEGNLLITGDLSISPQRTVDGARPPAFHPDVLVVESTYGGRLHANRTVQERKLIETVARVTATDGKVLIPAFALGRAQEILLLLSDSQRRGELPPVPIWADGMVRAICQAYTSFADVLPLALQERGARFFEGSVRPVQTVEQRNALVWQPGAAVIVASSGMLAGGPSLSYARALAGSPQHAILLTGYQDEESPGRRLQELAEKGHGTLRLGNDKVDVQCHLETYSLSAHADEGQLISLTETLNPERVVLVHGDAGARSSLEKALSQRGRIPHLPYSGQMLEFHFERRKLGRLEQTVYPEEFLSILGDSPPSEADLASIQPQSSAPVVMEPNQALAVANQYFPPTARLRKAGYRLAEQILVLTFDFPAVARQSFAEDIAVLQNTTGWKVEVFPEANQSALNAFVREVLPEDWQIIKSPAIYREQKRVAVVVSPPTRGTQQDLDEQVQAISQRFLAETGYELTLNLSAPAATSVVLPVAERGERLEINAAYSLIKSSLQGSTLYRTSLKDNEIMLSFISPQVGERYREQINAIEQQIGWQLTINPQPNQGAILEAARAMLNTAGWKVAKGPSYFSDKVEVTVNLSNSPDEQEISELETAFNDQTGYRLVVNVTQPVAQNSQSKKQNHEIVEIPLARIRLLPSHASLPLDPLKLNKAIERANRMGITPPIQVRRTRTDYVLVDGLYRLRAAEALKLDRIPAIVE